MGTGEQRLDELASIEFHGKVPKKIAAYAVATQRLAHDLAREAEEAADAAENAMRQLQGHPLLLGIDVKVRARRVARHLRDVRELALGISAEAVKFNQQFRIEFIEAGQQSRGPAYKGQVTL